MDQTAHALSQLITIHHHRSLGYKTAAEICGEPQLKNLFSDLSKQSNTFSNELCELVPGLESKATAASAGHNSWAEHTGNPEALLSESEFREEAATRTYDQLLEHEDFFQEPLYSTIKKHRTELHKTHVMIRSLYFTL